MARRKDAGAREADRVAWASAPLHVTAPERANELRAIRQRYLGNGAQEERMLHALATGDLTVREAVRELDVIDPQARFTSLRRRGINVVRRGWVRERSEAGELHTFGVYSIVEDGK